MPEDPIPHYPDAVGLVEGSACPLKMADPPPLCSPGFPFPVSARPP